MNEDCLATARRLSESGMHPFVLNMANRQIPGGGAKVLVLSAFGCGAFKNPPEQIAEIFKDELKAYDRTFEDVYFSIKPDHNDPSNKNFKAFEKVF